MMAALFAIPRALVKDDRPMNPTPRSNRWSCLILLIVASWLPGCGTAEPQGSVDGAAQVASVPAATDPAAQAVTRDDSTAEQPVPITAPEPAAVRDRATIDAAATQVQHATDQTAGAVRQAVGDAQDQGKQAANDAVDGVKGFATELRDDARRSFDDAADQLKTSAQGAADGMRRQIHGKINDAKGDARRRAQAAGANLQKQAEAAENRALDGVLGPNSANSNP